MEQKKVEVGSVVKFIDGLYADEIGAFYVVLETNGDRCILEAVTNLSIKPQSIARTSELEVL